MTSRGTNLDTFGRHVPRILKHQILSKLANQYIDEHGNPVVHIVDTSTDIHGDATVSRFHCAMLFVDISGFTVLSQRLKVDDLKEKINNYFELIVSIIVKYDGEIIKFAGDAIFVVFQTKVNRLGESACVVNPTRDIFNIPLLVADEARFLSACKAVADTAVVCGREVLAKCGHYPVHLGNDTNEDAAVASVSYKLAD
jgi:class 3 adenylate cyclase